MTTPEQTYLAAVKALNAAAYAALRASFKLESLPSHSRSFLGDIACLTDTLVDAGLDTAKGEV